VSKRDTYTITASRSGDWWALTVSGPSLKRSYHTQVKRLEQVEVMTRDLVVTMLDVDVLEMNADFDLTVSDDEVATETGGHAGNSSCGDSGQTEGCRSDASNGG
jgi:hypothetical protein